MSARLAVVEGDITALDVDAIVNAANPELRGGGGVDGAIHRAAGHDRLQAACREIGHCPTGEVRVTPGYDLKARFIFHAVGPVWRGGGAGEDDLLASCYSSAIRLAAEHDVASIAFPAISTGVYGFPPERAAPVAVAAVRAALLQASTVSEAIFCCFSSDSAALHRAAIDT
jgi:O-acetyl-ADP-ribose deacetylase (regulator of RNase III)